MEKGINILSYDVLAAGYANLAAGYATYPPGMQSSIFGACPKPG